MIFKILKEFKYLENFIKYIIFYKNLGYKKIEIINPIILMSKSVRTALCVVPPEFIWEPIQIIRKVHDKSFNRWMPHINILFPFIDDSNFDKVIPKLEEILSVIPSFDITFDKFDYFDRKGKEQTVWLNPNVVLNNDGSNSLQMVYNEMAELFPHLATRDVFIPHLSCGQFRPNDVKNIINKFNASWVPITVSINNIALISRDLNDNPFTVYKLIKLANI